RRACGSDIVHIILGSACTIATFVRSFFPFESAVAVSSFGTLFYYSVTNLSALRLKPNQRFYPRGLAIVGLVGCIALSIALPPQDIGIGVAIALADIALRLIRLKIILKLSR